MNPSQEASVARLPRRSDELSDLAEDPQKQRGMGCPWLFRAAHGRRLMMSRRCLFLE